MPNRNDKLRNVRIHAKRRAAERLGIHLNSAQLRLLSEKVRNGDGNFVRKSSNARTVWEIEVEGKPCMVVYDKPRKTIVTFLPNRELERVEVMPHALSEDREADAGEIVLTSEIDRSTVQEQPV